MLSVCDFSVRLDSIIALLQRLVQIESPSHDKAAVDRTGSEIQKELIRLEADIEIRSQTVAGDHIIARWGGTEGGEILLLCHMDTVFPIGTLTQNPFQRRGDLLTGPGVLDMKAGIAVFLSVMQTLRDTGRRPQCPITALFTSDEENGSPTSRPIIEELAGRASLVLCLEPALPNGALKTSRKGVGRFELTVRGKAAHAGAAHEEGRNAIVELAHQVLLIERLTNYERGTTLNVGVIAGGTASNVVPEEAHAKIDLRVMTQHEADRVIQSFHQLKPVMEGTSVECTGGLNRPPMPRDKRMAVTFEKAHSIAAGLGLNLLEDGSGGGSDANFVAPLCVPVLDGLGAQGDGMHSDREFVVIPSLTEKAALLAALLTTRW